MNKSSFKVIVNDHVVDEIQEAVDFYKEKQKSLGKRFYKSAKKTIKALENDALIYQIKYNDVRCVKIKKFPYLVHYKINQKSNTVIVYALICTYRNPEDNWLKE